MAPPPSGSQSLGGEQRNERFVRAPLEHSRTASRVLRVLTQLALLLHAFVAIEAAAQTTTGTFYALSGGTGTVWVDTEGPGYSVGHDASVGELTGSNVEVAQSWQDLGGDYYTIKRAFLAFNTSTIPASSTIVSATLFVYVTVRSGFTGFNVDVVNSTASSTSSLFTSDYDELGTTAGGSSSASALTAGAYRPITLTSTGRSWIIKSGFTKIGLRDSRDRTNNSSTTAGFMVMNGTGGNAPYLEIEYTTPTPTYTLNVQSSPDAGASVTVSPNDNSGQGSGTTNFARVYDQSTQVFLTAPSTHSSKNFVQWNLNGSFHSSSTSTNTTMSSNRTLTAVYETPLTAMYIDSSPDQGVAITVSPNDATGQGNGTTYFFRNFSTGTLVSLSAPSSFNGKNFTKWTRDGSEYDTNAATSVYADTPHTLVANYASVTPTDLTVSVDSAPTNAERGSNAAVTCTVFRTGGLLPAGGTTRLHLFLSQDPGSTGPDPPVYGQAQAFDFSNDILNSSGSSLGAASVPVPATKEGPWYFVAVVDPLDVYAESDETNNLDPYATTTAIWRSGTPAVDAGDLARTWDDSTVYWVRYSKKWHVLGGVFTDLGYTDADVQWYGSSALGAFAAGNEILQDDDGFVYRRASASTVYWIQGGQSRPFLNEAAFQENGFTDDDVYWASEVGFTWIQSQYPVGPPIEAAALILPKFAPLYRLYDSTGGARDHFYTTNEAEKSLAESNGYTFERIEGYVSVSPFTGGSPLYRVYDAGANSHFFTTQSSERDAKLSAGYVDEGVAGYVYASNVAGTVPFIRLREGTTGHYFLASRHPEYLAVLGGAFGGTWQLDQSGLAGFISPSGLKNPVGHLRQQARVEGVGSATGAFEIALDGIQFHGYGPAVNFQLFYNSQSTVAAPFSRGWGHAFSAFITEGTSVSGAPPVVVVTWGDGREMMFSWNGSSYEANPRSYLQLVPTVSPNKGYDLVTKDQTVFKFREFTLSDPVSIPGAPEILLTNVVDRYSNTVNVNRQASTGRVDWVDDPSGRRLTFAYDDPANALRLLGVTDTTLSRTLSFGYDAGQLTSFTNARSGITQLAYNSGGLLSTVTYPRGVGGRTLQMTYDTEGRVSSSNGRCDQPVMQFSYGGVPAAVPATMSIRNSANSVVAEFVNDPAGLCLSQVKDAVPGTGSPNSSIIECLDTNHPTLPTRIVDFNGNATEFTYDANSNVQTVTNAEGKIAAFNFDTKNNILSATDFGSPTRITNYTWDAQGLTLESVEDPTNLVTEYDSNSRGQTTNIRDPLSRETLLAYDAQGNLEDQTDPLNHTTHFVHDAAGRRTSVTDAETRTTQYQFDNNDNLTWVTDALGHPKHLTYDANDNLASIWYVRAGVQDTISYAYDSNDCLESVQDPNGGSIAYTYDAEGRVASRTDALSQLTNYTYDENSRLDTISYVGDAEAVSFEYDANGNMIEVDESWLATGPQNFAYDVLGRIDSHTNTFGQTVAYAYDDASNLLRFTYPSSAGVKEVDYTYDLASRLDTVTDWTAGLVDFGYDNASNLTSEVHPNGISTQYGYDLASRLDSITHRRSDTSVFASYGFTLDDVGNHTSVTSVDPLSAPDPAVSDTVYTIDKDNRLIADSEGVTYAHDSNGNRTSRTAAGVTTTYDYDFENRLTQVSEPGTTIDHIYDGLGNRIAKVVNGVVTRYVLDLSGSMSAVLAETDASNSASAYYVYGQGLAAQITPAGNRYAYHFDNRGSTVAISDLAESLSNRYAYNAFGEVADDQVSVPNHFKYAGRFGVLDEANGQHFMRARFYDGRSGRFLAKDPVSFEGGDWNLYAYVGNNPVMGLDPTGQKNWFTRGAERFVNWARSTEINVLADGQWGFIGGGQVSVGLTTSGGGTIVGTETEIRGLYVAFESSAQIENEYRPLPSTMGSEQSISKINALTSSFSIKALGGFGASIDWIREDDGRRRYLVPSAHFGPGLGFSYMPFAHRSETIYSVPIR